VFATSITIVQIFLYERGTQKISKVCAALEFLGLCSILLLAILSSAERFTWLNFFYYLSLVKLVITFVKYCPQVLLNYQRKSTIGWNIWNVLLDFSGGVLSTFQLVFDAYYENSWTGIAGDPVKVGLGLVSMVFDIIFMVQHYVVYKHSNTDTSATNTTQQYEQIQPTSDVCPMAHTSEESSTARVEKEPFL